MIQMYFPDSLLVCTNFKSAYLSIKLFYSNSHKLLSPLCTPNEMIKPILPYPKLKMFLYMLKFIVTQSEK